MIYPIYLIALCIPVETALLREYKRTKNFYILCALIMTAVFQSVYLYIGFADPPIEIARDIARYGFVLMWSVGAFASLRYLFHR